MPIEVPGDSVPPLLTTVVPTVPVPPSVPPLLTVTLDNAIEPVTSNVPALTVVAPLYKFTPERVSVPAPACWTVPVPETTPP